MKLVFTAGSFDMLHIGHLNLLRACRAIAGPDGKVVVGLNTTEFIEQYKGERPIQSYEERRRALVALRDVDIVEDNGSDSTETFKTALRMIDGVPWWSRIVIVGSDWAVKDYGAQTGFTRQWLHENGTILLYHPYTEGISTSKLRRHLAD